MKQTLTKLLRDDRAAQRALDFTTSFVVAGNVLGEKERCDLQSLMPESATEFLLRRQEPWDAEDRKKTQIAKVSPTPGPFTTLFITSIYQH